MKRAAVRTVAALLLAGLLPGWAAAAISTNDDAELFVVLWDPAAHVSYTRDLGLSTYYGADAGQRADSFFVQGQSDAGYQRFWSDDFLTDPNYTRFRTAATDPTRVRWAVLGVDTMDEQGAFEPGEHRVFTTLRQGDADGVTNPRYTALTSLTNDDWDAQVGVMQFGFITPLNTAATSDSGGLNPFNTHRSPSGASDDYALNGSSFDTQGQSAYFDGGHGSATFGQACNCDVWNLAGRSSWFYATTRSNDFDGTTPIAVDEFDNLGADGYWGLAIRPDDSQFVLSYTLAPALPVALTDAGRQRLALTEFDQGEVTRVIAAPAGEFALPVPQPPSLPLLAAGCTVLLAWQWRRKKKGGRD